jgi:hypothetical protein
MKTRRRESIHLMSGWNDTVSVTVWTKGSKATDFKRREYKPTKSSAQRLQNAINDRLKDTHNRPSVEITLMGDTIFVDIEE